MRKLIVSEFLTLDGVMEGPGGEGDHPHAGWVFDFFGPEQEKYKLDETLEADILLLGRVTYEGFADAWPQRSGAFANKMNTMRKYVASKQVRGLKWNNSRLLDGKVPEAVSDLRQSDGGPILVAGSRTLVQTLMKHDLVDEYRLMVHPVVVGGGMRLFADNGAKTVLKLVDAQAFSTGVVVYTYHPADS